MCKLDILEEILWLVSMDLHTGMQLKMMIIEEFMLNNKVYTKYCKIK